MKSILSKRNILLVAILAGISIIIIYLLSPIRLNLTNPDKGLFCYKSDFTGNPFHGDLLKCCGESECCGSPGPCILNGCFHCK